MFINQYRQIIIGITSWGPYCEHTPAVNFKVSGDLKAWIWSIAPEAKESYGCNLWWSSFYSIFWFYLRINEIFSLRILVMKFKTSEASDKSSRNETAPCKRCRFWQLAVFLQSNNNDLELLFWNFQGWNNMRCQSVKIYGSLGNTSTKVSNYLLQQLSFDMLLLSHSKMYSLKTKN